MHKRSLGKRRCRKEDNIKMDLKGKKVVDSCDSEEVRPLCTRKLTFGPHKRWEFLKYLRNKLHPSFYPEDGGNIMLLNVGKYVLDCIVPRHKRQNCS
jgi:hypothetical protein